MRAAQDRLREVFSLHGYQVLETPILEPTELFLRKSGGELAARLYTFTDQGGNQVSLRPEYTASILRYYMEQPNSGLLPMRVQYAGPVFRHEEDSNVYRQFTQVGAELLGSSNPRADAEVLSLSCQALSSLGLSGHRLEIGDLGILHQILESMDLSERAIVFILSNISELKKGQDGLAGVRERAKQLRLLMSDPQQTYLSGAIRDMEEGEARDLLHGLLQWTDVGSFGQRRASEVVERLLRKFRGTDDPGKLQQGLDVAYTLAAVRGEPERCFKEVGELIESYGLNPAASDRLKQVIGLLDVDQLHGTTVVLDFGLARGLAYYTGIVFEIWHPSHDTSLGGGGRYDGLAKALGNPLSISALGFAFNLEFLVECLESEGNMRKPCIDKPKGVLVMTAEGTGYREGLRLAQQLRSGGTPVEIDVCGMSVEESLSYAGNRGISEVIAVDDDGKRTTYQVPPG